MNSDEFEELLPWYATGTLEPEEARSVEAHLAGSAEARAELARFQALHSVVQDTSGEPEFNPGLINDAFARIDALERESSERAARGGLAGWLRRNLVPTWEATPGVARLALATQLALLVALGAALLLPREPEAGFQTVAGAARSDRAHIALGFTAETRDGEIRALLGELDAEIVSGPSALGLYTVELPYKPDERAQVDEVVEGLRARGEQVRFAGKIE